MVIPALAVLAGNTLAQAMLTDGWEEVRFKVAAMFGRGQPDAQAEQRLDEGRAELAEVDGAALEFAKIAVAVQWQARFADLLAGHPELESELAALVTEIQSAADGPDRGETLPAAAFLIDPDTDDDLPDVILDEEDRGAAVTHRDVSEHTRRHQPPVAAAQPGALMPPAGLAAPARSAHSGQLAFDTDYAWPPIPASAASRTVPGASELDPISSALDAAVRPGVLAFNPATEMTQGRKERVEVAIARSPELREALVASFQGRGQVQTADVQAAAYMSVELRSDAFSIVALSPAEQVVAPTARWEFDVKPVRPGLQTLTLSVSLSVERLLPGAPPGTRLAVPVLERAIRIRVDLAYSTRTFAARNWQWLVGTGIAAAAAGATYLTIYH